jgi:alpha-tubulin suppressor-like RCC1 family protein
MKLVPSDNQNALSALRTVLVLTAIALLPLLLYGSAPSWWSPRAVLTEGVAADDFAPVNQGQLKNIAKAAAAEMDLKLAGGAGDDLHGLIVSWSSPGASTNDFAPVNLGQLKTVAQPFYDRLIAAGQVDFYPWLASPNPPDDFAGANIGQVKKLFSFEIRSNPLGDPLQDRLAAGQRFGNFALEASAVWFWGNRFGFDTSFQNTYPRRLIGLPGISSVSAGDDHCVLLTETGTVLTWGKNNYGQLGDATNVDRETPAAVPNLANIISVKAGATYTLALQQNGTVLAWGENYYGQLGNGDNIDSSSPVQVVGLSSVRKIAAGPYRGVALLEDGTVWVWGYDHYADGRDISNNTPVQVSGLVDVIDIAVGYEHVVTVKADGTVWTWGSNYFNQVGNGAPATAFIASPVQVPNLANVVKVASNFYHSLALLSDGTVWAWGLNNFGQLGDGTNASRRLPVQVSGLTGVIALATTYQYSMAMKADGTVWTWGEGCSGTVPGVDLRVPQQVGLGLFDLNHNGLDDRWEQEYFGNLDQNGNEDFDGDGISNLLEFRRGTDPRDYFNGVTPIIEIAGGNNQVGEPGMFLGKPFKVRLQNAAGKLLVNAPVRFTVSDGAGAVAATLNGPQEQSLLVRTDTNGEAAAYHVLPNAPGASTRTIASADGSGASASAAFRGIAKLSLPTPTPPPSATPDPNASPTPTPSPTATPIAPYRYAMIDLGKDMYPLRINNKGQILLTGSDANGQPTNFRWTGGNLERLSYSNLYATAQVVDMNDAGTVIGNIGGPISWQNYVENEKEAGLVWTAGNANPRKISGPTFEPFELQFFGTLRFASLSTILNSGEIFGSLCTGVVAGFFNHTTMVINGIKWPNDSSPLVVLSDLGGAYNPFDYFSYWSGSSDTVSRANTDGHYIGHKFTPFPRTFIFLEGTSTGMVDGQSVSFEPIDINEAGIVVGSAGADMVVGSSQVPQITISGASPLAINDHTYPAPSPAAQPAPGPAPQPTATPIPAPQILSWVGNALAIWERQPDGKTWHPFGLEEMIPSMDGWKYIEPYDMNDTGAIVGRAWYTDPSIPGAPGEYHAFLLVPVELMVDGNRDGEMSFRDPAIHAEDQTTEEMPFRFWLNDDQDARSGTNISEEITPPQLKDNQDEIIQSVRDCEDLTRIWLNVSGMTEGFKAGTFKLVLKFRNITSGNPAIRAFRAAESGGRGYLTNEAWGALQASPPFNRALPGTQGASVASSTGGIHIARQFWEGIDESNPVIDILFEGVEEGKGELFVEVVRDGKKIGTSSGVWLDIKNVQKFYERAKAQPEDIVAPYISSQPFVGPVGYVGDPFGHPFEKAGDETKQCAVFVHGWNVSYDEYVGVAQTMFKRLWHQGFKGHFASFRWDTRKSDALFDAGEYNRSENRAYVYAGALKQWASDLSNDYSVSVLAHSMGNIVCGEALRQGLQVRNYVLMEAAIPMSCYMSDATRSPRLEDRERDYPTPDYHRNPTTNELILGYRGYLSSVSANMVNFYNVDDWALATGTTEIVPGLPHKETNWEVNQIDYKPDGEIPDVLHSFAWRYYHDPNHPSNLPLARRAWVESAFGRVVSDSWEIKAFVARSRTKAVGAFPNGGEIFTQNINLNSDPYNFGRERLDHSGQFTRDIQKVDALYKTIRETLEQ